MRISGLNSGMDTEQIIKDIMTAQRIPVDRVFQQKVQAEWKRDAYRDVNLKLSRFRDFTWSMRLSSTLEKYTATSSRTDLLTATATGRAQAGTYDLKVDKLATSAQFVSNPVTVPGEPAEPEGGETPKEKITSITINGTEIDISKYETAEELAAGVAKAINDDKDLGISAFAHGDKVSFTTTATGADAKIEVDENFVKIFGGSVTIVPPEGEDSGVGVGILMEETGEEVRGQDAVVTINGLETKQSSNSFEFNGIAVNLLKADTGATIRIEVSQDVDAVVDKVKEFVNMYNELVDELNLALREKAYRDFPPLTDAQRADLSDKEIELWEEKAKSGLLRSDSIISGILSEMRLALGGSVKDGETSLTLAQIGITTGAWHEYGRLNLNEDKLRSAIEENPDVVRDLFAQDGEEGSELGLSRRITTALDNGMARLERTAGKASIAFDQSFLGERIREYESRLSAMEERLLRYEESQWAKFAAMERVLGQLYSQGDWLTQQLMALQG